MKILMPYIQMDGQPFSSGNITGGIKAFGRMISEFIPDLIVAEITKEDRSHGRSNEVFQQAIRQHKPDLIWVNDIDGYFNNTGIPTIQILHEPPVGDIRYMALYKRMQPFIDAGGHLYFVSNRQREFFKKHHKRITGKELERYKENLVRPAHVKDNTTYGFPIFDAVTIGRTDILKDPFWIHKKLDGTNLRSCVLTNTPGQCKNPKQNEYAEKNSNWNSRERQTIRDLSHDEVLTILSRSGCYISTCPQESWGISALEALTHGVPLILLTDATGTHSSQEIAAKPEHYRLLRKSCKTQDLIDTVKFFSALSQSDRIEIATLTKQKHSRANFEEMVANILYERISDIARTTSSIRSLI